MALPACTYRLQIRRGFDLAAAAGIVDYLHALGVDALYLSPILHATSGSDHGYDTVDHAQVDPERGGEAGRRVLAEATRRSDLKTVLDIVPNHMGVADAAQNTAWWDLLRLGQESAYAAWFDVDWATGRIRIPILGDDFTAEQLRVVDGELRYFSHRFPVAPGTAEPGDTGAQVHSRQKYELVRYRRADTEQNYRRFFAVTELAAIRVEDPAVFNATHHAVLSWVADGDVDGIRIDHPDGLADPVAYLDRLRASAPEAWITVEKITEPGERLPVGWPVAGTTGYDALSEVNALLYSPAAEPEVTRRYAELTGDTRDWNTHLEQGKRLVATTILRAEILRLARMMPELPRAADALTELAVAFAVYRSYHPVAGEHLTHAADLAARRRIDLADAIRDLLPRLRDPGDELCTRFEQATGAIMAKGVEDTAYYRFTRAVGLNEVGGDPGCFGGTVADFHAQLMQRQRLLPASMTTLSTHDTKRSEDVRARLAVLPELGEQWYAPASQLLARHPIPNAAFGYLLWQTFVGAGGIERERMHAYAEKAMREASDGTCWRDPVAPFETAVHAAVDAGYDDPTTRGILAGLTAVVTPFGWSNSLSQKLIQLTMPGIGDVYQGTELFDYSLVDPDNRRPVDFGTRWHLLRQLDASPRPPVLDDSGAAKLWLTSRILRQRRDHPDRFTDYRPVETGGLAADHVVAFDRGGAVSIATRLPVSLHRSGGWRATTVTLPGGRWHDRLTDRAFAGMVELAELLSVYPVAFLTS